MFRGVDREARIYQQMPLPVDAFVAPRVGPRTLGEPLPIPPPVPFRLPSEARIHRDALERLAPPSIVVDESYRMVHLSEHAGRYLQSSGGALTNDITELAREELRFDIRAALIEFSPAMKRASAGRSAFVSTAPCAGFICSRDP